MASVPQSEPLNELQQRNNAGGFSFVIDDIQRVYRFVILGSEGGSYYVKQAELTVENAKCVKALLDAGKGPDIVKIVVDISTAGRAPKQGPGLFVLAMCIQLGDAAARKAALGALAAVCRTASTLCQLLDYAKTIGVAVKKAENLEAPCKNSCMSWGRAMRCAVAAWYLEKDPKDLAYQVTKYGQRSGWSNRDLLRLSHADPKSLKRKASSTLNSGDEKRAKADDHADSSAVVEPSAISVEVDAKVQALQQVFHYIVKGEIDADGASTAEHGIVKEVVEYLTAVTKLRKELTAEDVSEACELIKKHRLVWEHVGDTKLLKDVQIWSTLLSNGMPMTALLRNLARLSSLGMFNHDTTPDAGEHIAAVVQRLTNEKAIQAARLHPIVILDAMRLYATGKGRKGSLTWTPCSEISAALDTAFYAAFKNAEPTGKRFLLALDVSGSMTWAQCVGMEGLRAHEAAAAMLMSTARSEQNVTTLAFSHELVPLKYRKDQSLDDFLAMASSISMGGTDCSLPMVHALKHKIPIDVFVVYTDNETWCGGVHPAEALRQYRAGMGIAAKLVVMAMSVSKFSIADPNDGGMLDVAGIDSGVPQVLRDFVMGC